MVWKASARSPQDLPLPRHLNINYQMPITPAAPFSLPPNNEPIFVNLNVQPHGMDRLVTEKMQQS